MPVLYVSNPYYDEIIRRHSQSGDIYIPTNNDQYTSMQHHRRINHVTQAAKEKYRLLLQEHYPNATLIPDDTPPIQCTDNNIIGPITEYFVDDKNDSPTQPIITINKMHTLIAEHLSPTQYTNTNNTAPHDTVIILSQVGNYINQHMTELQQRIQNYTNTRTYSTPHIAHVDNPISPININDITHLPDHTILLGGVPDAESIPVFAPYNNDQSIYRAYGLSQDTRDKCNAIGYIHHIYTDDTGTSKNIYWFPGYVPYGSGIITAIIRTIEHIYGNQDIQHVMEHIFYEHSIDFKPLAPNNLKQLIRNKINLERRYANTIASIQNNNENNSEYTKSIQKQKTLFQEYHRLLHEKPLDPQKVAERDIHALLNIPEVDRVLVEDNTLHIYTHEIIAHPISSNDEDDDENYEDNRYKPIRIGHMRISIILGENERIESFADNIIAIHNLDRNPYYYEGGTEYGHAPHLRPRPCWGNAEEGLNTLYKNNHYPELVMYIIQYLQTYNTSDSWGEDGIYWPKIQDWNEYIEPIIQQRKNTPQTHPHTHEEIGRAHV